MSRTLSATGEIRMEYDAKALPLLRAMPGARWNKVAKSWIVSTAPADLPRVIELASRLGIEVDPALSDVEETADVMMARRRAFDAKAYPHQIKGAAWLAGRDRGLLADEMGVGKTATALLAVEDAARVLVVCPAVVKSVWAQEIARWRPEFKVRVVRGRQSTPSFPWPDRWEIVIVNFDILPDGLLEGAPVTWGAPHLVSTTLIVDEAHAVKSHKATRSQKVRALSAACKKTWFLTGTPLLGRPFDLYGVVRCGGMDREAFGGWNGFLRLFQGFPGQWGGYEFGDPLPEAGERLRRVMLRRTRSEVLPDLPKKVRQTVFVELPDQLSEQMDRAWNEWGADPESSELPSFEEFSLLRRDVAEWRTPYAVAIVEQYEEQEIPLLVFSCHRFPVDEIGSRKGWGAITGDTTPVMRAALVSSFQAGRLKGLALTVQAGGVGITLTRASHALFVDLDWTPAINSQAEDRMVRIGQEAQSVQIIRLSSEHPLDCHVLRILDQKSVLIESVVEAKLTPPLPAPHASPDSCARGPVAPQEEPWTEEGAREATEKILSLLSVCDGARTKDGQGFSKIDRPFAESLANNGIKTAKQLSAARRMLRKYRRQLGETEA